MATPAKRLLRRRHAAHDPPAWDTTRPVYRPRRPTATPLYPVVQHHLGTFLAHAVDSDRLGHGAPTWIVKMGDLRRYLVAFAGAVYRNPKSICPQNHLLPRVIRG